MRPISFLPRNDAAVLLAHPLYLIRHGETDWNASGRLQGHQNIGLNRVGEEQSQEAALRLLACAPDCSTYRYSASPLRRARDSMALLRKTLGITPDTYCIDPVLRELSFGEWEGLSWDEVRLRYPSQHKDRKRNKWSFTPPGGDSYAHLAARLRPWLAEFQETAVVVSHSGVMRAILVVLGCVAEQDAPSLFMRQGSVLKVKGRTFTWM